METWKKIIGYENLYEISNYGNVKSLKKGFKKEKLLKNRHDNVGYARVDLRLNNISKTIRVHRLVAIHFIDILEDKPQVNHINGIKDDNRVENLEWVSNTENQCHRYDKTKTASKFIGVSRQRKNWKAQITHKGKDIYLGYFKTEELAYAARVDFEKENNIINKYI
jgi:hypothetical protein